MPVRVERLLTLGLGRSRAEVRRMVADGRIRLPLALDAKAHQDFEFTVDGSGVPASRPGSGLVYVVDDEQRHTAGLRGRDRKSTRLNSSHEVPSRMPSSA